jgi:hypothetical protein
MMSIKLLASAMKLLVLSDYDSFRYTLGKEPADVLISCGDIADQVILAAAEAVQ